MSQNTLPHRDRMPGWHRLWTGSRLPSLLYGLHARILRLAPPVTIGVRLPIADDGGRVMLIRHTYRPGWGRRCSPTPSCRRWRFAPADSVPLGLARLAEPPRRSVCGRRQDRRPSPLPSRTDQPMVDAIPIIDIAGARSDDPDPPRARTPGADHACTTGSFMVMTRHGIDQRRRQVAHEQTGMGQGGHDDR